MKKLVYSLSILLFNISFAQTPVFKSISSPLQTNGGFIIIQKGVVASNGDYYIIGIFSGPVDFDLGPNVVNAPNPYHTEGYFDAFIAKYSSTDALLWMKAMWTRGPFINQGSAKDPHLRFNDITIGADGNVYIVGDILGTADGIGDQVNGFVVVNAELPRAFAKGLTPAGAVIFNASNEHGIILSASTGEGIAADGSGNVFITGFQSGEVNGISSGSQQHAYYAKFNSSGVRINQGWMIQTSTTPSDFNSNRHSRGNAIAVDGSGNIYITGFFGQSADFDPGAGTNIINSVNLKDAFIAKWTSSNALSWVRTYSTASEGTEIELDANGNVYAAVGNNFIKLTNAGADSWNRNLGYAHSFTINASNELLVVRTNTELRFLKLSAANVILYEIAPTYVSGSSTNVNRSFVGEYGNGDVRWINKSVSNYNYGNGPSGDLADGAFIRYGIANTAPTNIILSAASINENNAVNAVIGTLTSTDANPGDSHTYSLVAGTGSTDNASFNISGNQLRAGIAFNYEAKSSYSIRVRSNDGEATFDKVFTITINDVAEDLNAPTVVSLSPLDDATNVPVNSNFAITFNEPISLLPGAVLVGFFKNGALDFTLGTNSPFVNVSGNTLTIDLNDDLLPATAYAIYFNPYIQDMSGNVVTTLNNQTFWNFTTAAAANSAPTNIILSAASINENNAVNAVIGTLSTTDSDVGDSHTYSLVAGTGSTDNASFNISGNQLRASAVFDFESKNSYSIRVRTNDGQATFEKVFTITILDLTDTDVTPPTVLSLSPADDATNVPVNATFVATFSEDIMLQPGIGLVAIAKEGIIQITYNASSPELSVSGSVLTINPSSDLLPNANYIMYVGGGVKDLDGNSIGEVLNLATSWNFTTGATSSAPSIKYQFPENGATEMEIDLYGNDLAFDFEDDVSTGSGAVVLIKNYANDELIESIDIANQTYTGGFVEVPVTSLPYDTKVYIVIEPIGSITSDETGLTFAGLDDKDDWTFTTIAAPVPPLISSLSPADNATNVPVNSILSLDFDVDVYVSSDVSLEIRNYQTDALIESLPISEAAYVDQPIVITPMNDLPMETQLYVILSGSGYIEGYDCNCTEFEGLTNKDDWSFTTQGALDVTSPTIIDRTPYNGSNFGFLNSGVNFTFSETVVEGSGTVVLYDENDQVLETVATGLSDTRISLAANPRVVVDFDYEVAEGTLYKVSIDQGAFEDAAGNPADGILASAWSFTTISRPQVTTLSPLDGSTDVAVDADLIIHFDQIVNGQDDPTSNVYVKNFDTDAIIATVNTSAMTFDYDFDEETTIVTIDLIDDLPENLHLYVQTDVSTVFTSNSNGSTATVLNDKGVWDFTTETLDMDAPVPLTLSPVDGSEDVALDQVFSITFDEDILPPSSTLTGFLRIILPDVQVINIPYTTASVTEGWLSVSGNTVSFSRGTLTNDESYYVSIDDNTLADLNGNKLTGYGLDTWWNFTTVGLPASILWNGTSWSNSVGPTAADEATIAGDFTFSDDGVFECNDLVINSGATLLVDDTETLVVNGTITNYGAMTIASGASLITYSGKAITGNWIDVKRATRYADGKYSFVGTPMGLATFNTGASIGNPTYQYLEYEPYGSDGLARWESINEFHYLIPGQGYAQAFKKELIFTGRPNTGTITYAGTYTEDTDDANEGWNLVANPYPAAIFIDDFIDTNLDATTGAIYLWDDNDSQTSRGSNDDYIVANKTGAIDINATDGLGPNSQSRWNGHIGSAQGFLIQMDGVPGDVTFTETMRRANQNGDDNFFRKAVDETPLLRINLTSSDGLIRQTVVGWNEQESDEKFTKGYDAPVFNASSDYMIYTIKADRNLAIQTVTSQKEEIPIGYTVAEEGNYQLEFHEEHFSSEPLYLLDRIMDKVITINSGDYVFSTKAGQFADRFVLLKTYNVLASDIQKSSLYVSDKILHINTTGTQPAQYQLYNLSGKKLLTTSITRKSEINLSHLPDGIYIVSDGIASKKIVLK